MNHEKMNGYFVPVDQFEKLPDEFRRILFSIGVGSHQGSQDEFNGKLRRIRNFLDSDELEEQTFSKPQINAFFDDFLFVVHEQIKKNQFAEAEALLDEAWNAISPLNLDESFKPKINGLKLFIARCSLEKDDLKKFKRFFSPVVDSSSNNVETLTEFVFLLRTKRHYSTCSWMIDLALKYSPGDKVLATWKDEIDLLVELEGGNTVKNVPDENANLVMGDFRPVSVTGTNAGLPPSVNRSNTGPFHVPPRQSDAPVENVHLVMGDFRPISVTGMNVGLPPGVHHSNMGPFHVPPRQPNVSNENANSAMADYRPTSGAGTNAGLPPSVNRSSVSPSKVPPRQPDVPDDNPNLAMGHFPPISAARANVGLPPGANRSNAGQFNAPPRQPDVPDEYSLFGKGSVNYMPPSPTEPPKAARSGGKQPGSYSSVLKSGPGPTPRAPTPRLVDTWTMPSITGLPEGMDDAYISRLGCMSCFRSKPGANEGDYLSQLKHECLKSFLILRPRDDAGWIKVRPAGQMNFKGSVRFCTRNENGTPCPDNCWFAHSEEEQYLWEMHRTKLFDLNAYIRKLHEATSAASAASGAAGETDMQRTESNQANLPQPLHLHLVTAACQNCILPVTGYSGRFTLTGPRNRHEQCTKDILLVRKQGDDLWVKIRPKSHTVQFRGEYAMCKHVAESRKCRFWHGEDLCRFAHSEEEKILWTMEKDHLFHHDDYIKKHANPADDEIASFLRKHHGSFFYICTECYRLKPARISFRGGDTCTGPQHHEWNTSRVLAFNTRQEKQITYIRIGQKPSNQTSFFNCANRQFCTVPNCAFAHSCVERDFWNIMRDLAMDYEELANTLIQKSKTTVAAAPVERERRCPYKVALACPVCWTQFNEVHFNKGTQCDHPRKSHSWAGKPACLLLPQQKEIRPLPPIVPKGFKYTMCADFLAKKKCKRSDCHFAHSQEEIEVWTFMAMGKIKKLEDLVKMIEEDEQARNGEPIQLYCSVCSMAFGSEASLKTHNESVEHRSNVETDKEIQWNCRPPPADVGTDQFLLCVLHVSDNGCQFSHKPDEENHCPKAHSQQELDEWKERIRWRRLKQEAHGGRSSFPYMDDLMKRYNEADNGAEVLSEQLDGIKVNLKGKDVSHTQYLMDKSQNHEFHFVVRAEKNQQLKKVALLRETGRLHFYISHRTTLIQMVEGEDCLRKAEGKTRTYEVVVKFEGGLLGSFEQWVVFDFGPYPKLIQKLNVQVGTDATQQKIIQLRKQLGHGRWTSDNVIIERFEKKGGDPLLGEWLKRYRLPDKVEEAVTQNVLTDLNRNNYIHQMHNLLFLEEYTRNRRISEYRVKEIDVTLSATIQSTSGFVSVLHQGQLFGRIPLPEPLCEDSDLSKLILMNCETILACFSEAGVDPEQVYECLIVKRDNFDVDGRFKDSLHICLPENFVAAFDLRNDTTVKMDVQFQLDRAHFCRIHHALDQLGPADIDTFLFPVASQMNRAAAKTTPKEVPDSWKLNDEQRFAVQQLIQIGVDESASPMILHGPFGTGKTFTVAHCIMALLEHQPQCRILLATHSNSAADLYITNHFRQYFTRKGQNKKMLRVYARNRWLKTVSEEVLEYCLLAWSATTSGASFSDQSPTHFLMPEQDDIKESRLVIVTLSTAMHLVLKGMKGLFTHVFLDEAAQTLEGEAIIPLVLAGPKTKLVLAGDPKQMSPRVYSDVARDKGLAMSILERLFLHNRKVCLMDNNVLLFRNFRSRTEILSFISEHFYGDKNRLRAEFDEPIPAFPPFSFYDVRGRIVQDKDSVSYINDDETKTAVTVVKNLIETWPQKWIPGPTQWDATHRQICVLSAFSDQVAHMRRAMRINRLFDIDVNPISSIQGKEYRVIVISTVVTGEVAENTVAKQKGNKLDFGFLTDVKLLNTAFTRAQSHVAVIGDASALRRTGDCKNIWKSYIDQCHKNHQLFE